ncbi:hypothetical protein [Saccharopolyspora phatthalungensis]|uniref:PBP domain-containing protein n=1 Tax=Saccharopolyspora phatthalungensis TaxID=664693 RepID=A0A840Q4T0_9PSEU|nr:hypothetical protein [Saccharopolyspora phatthalungensis]MBB5155486.1 hypothetical protein [Saccharopolyspora phatthalungensis]
MSVVSWGETVQALAALFGDHVGSSVLAVLAVVTIAAPVVDRFIIRRKRLHYRVLYNSKIGLSPIELHDGEVPPADPQLIRIARLVDRMSIVIIRIRNTGSFGTVRERLAQRLAGAKTTRCERTETQDAIAAIAATPGAIGYADAPAASRTIAEGRTLEIVELDGQYPEESSALHGYRFKTVEYLYTKGNPSEGSLLDRFIDYLGSDTGRAELRDGGYAPCIGRDGLLHPLCRGS